MAEDSLTERFHPFNQLSLSSSALADFQLSERAANLEQAILLMAQAQALSSMVLRDAFSDSSPSERHHYMAALHEIIVAASDLLEDLQPVNSAAAKR